MVKIGPYAKYNVSGIYVYFNEVFTFSRILISACLIPNSRVHLSRYIMAAVVDWIRSVMIPKPFKFGANANFTSRVRQVQVAFLSDFFGFRPLY